MRSIFITVFILACCLALHADEPKPNDARLASLLVGTWETRSEDNLDHVIAESTFDADGTLSGFSLRTLEGSDHAPRTERVSVRARWKVVNGYLYVSNFETDPTGILPEGHSVKYMIVSVSEELAIWRLPESGVTLVRTRKRG